MKILQMLSAQQLKKPGSGDHSTAQSKEPKFPFHLMPREFSASVGRLPYFD
jgi:hypothetical protein